MKNLRYLILIFFIGGTLSLTAQISVGAGAGIIKSSGDNTEVLFGGDFALKYHLETARTTVRAGINFGYYQKSDNQAPNFTVSLVPISFSAEYLFLIDRFHPYVGLHLGQLKTAFKLGNTKNTESYFSLAPVVGIDYRLLGKFNLNVNFKYGIAFDRNDFTDEIESFSTISPNIGIFYLF